MSESIKECVRRTSIIETLQELYPGDARELCELDFQTPFQLGVATILSAQCTDVTVNGVTPALFSRYPDAYALAVADLGEVERLIYRTGFFRSKAKSIVGMAVRLVDRFGGEMPQAMEDLVTLPGVGRKTANVIRSVAFGLPGLAVDTHVIRLSGLLGFSDSKDPVVIERELNSWIDPSQWGVVSLRLISHGRRTCIARRPRCSTCELVELCPSAVV